MAAIRKRNGKFQARIHRAGFPTVSKTFLSRSDAQRWARETEVRLERTGLVSKALTGRDAIGRYLENVTPSKKNARVETQRLRYWQRDDLSTQPLDRIRVSDLARWRDKRLAEGLSGSTVRNYLAALSAVYRHAASEWGYQQLENPVARLKRPSPGKARTRRISDAELEVIKAVTQSRHLAALIDLAVETAMRLSELVNLRWRYIDLNARTAHLPDTKNGHPRTIPLSTKAVETLRGLRQNIFQQLDGQVFGLTPHAVTVAFRRACSRARKQSEGRLAADLRFHDIRHEAVSRLFERGLNPIEVASISGHRSMQMLARYTHISTASLIAKLG
jgi:integrase